MKKSSFIALVLGTVSGLFFAIGMCMALLPEWYMFWPGVVLGSVGAVLGIITVLIWRKMEKKAPIKFSSKGVLTVAVAVVGALLLGVGMCFCMVWSNMVVGVIIGVVGIAVLLTLIPLIVGIKD